jgi:hypothetical protein
MTVTPANAVPTRKTSTPRTTAKRTAGAAGRSPEKRADVTETPAVVETPVPVADPAAEIERLKAELAKAREAARATKAAKKTAHESGYRGALTKPVDGKVADFCAWVESRFPELFSGDDVETALTARERRFVLITIRSYGAFQAEVNGRVVPE